ncbi:hypothetical protein CONPUDRAFT_48875 [Coniophora puteana RWD-64-598 SS2]|uniref:SLC41A/MgtE integral membrane domain-containing protein n=1 Tax=Coniophora puteana (strain RWD-64-598) TaxID=741705 RepID=A0A5M3N2P8_CONPW|nr:uncharacterized protein CONPUDRAFT_48875 [Coniophora puteana RWD-64-598 SS2]EIW85659.1 hypothetical protein CONPUDRAFT_48875 [Coniophora puteana RWD-64-598 SS2]
MDLANVDEGRTALLGAEGRTRGWERRPAAPQSTWAQVSGIVLESAPTLLLTSIGLLFTGELLDHVSRWRAMRTIDELIMIIPVILNLKGNLEMNLSARLGTAANTGVLDDPHVRKRTVLGNLTLLQVQATVVAFVAACVSMLLGLFVPAVASASPTATAEAGAVAAGAVRGLIFKRKPRPKPPIIDGRPRSGIAEYVSPSLVHKHVHILTTPRFILVASTAMLSACMSSLVLGTFMCGLILLCRRLGRDPDNIAPPIAACLGDLVTLALLGLTSSVLITFVNTSFPLLIGVLLTASAALCVTMVRKNRHVRSLLTQGWGPLFGAMVITSASGIVLDMFAQRYQGFPILAIVISGLPGSVGSIFVSRLSTALHASAASAAHPHPSSEPSKPAPAAPAPRLVALTLLLVTLPVEVLFLTLLRAFGWLSLPLVFAVFAMLFFCTAVSISLLFARRLTEWLWARGRDPDMDAMPLHSAAMDLLGQLLLVLCFELVGLLGVKMER